MSENLSRKILEKALKSLKSPLDEEGQPLPLIVKVPLAREIEHRGWCKGHRNWLKRAIAFAKQRRAYHRRRAKSHPWEYSPLELREKFGMSLPITAVLLYCPKVVMTGQTEVLFNGEDLNRPGTRRIILVLEIGEIPLLKIERIASHKASQDWNEWVKGTEPGKREYVKIVCPFGVVGRKGTKIFYNGENLCQVGVQRVTLTLTVGEVPRCVIDHIPVEEE